MLACGITMSLSSLLPSETSSLRSAYSFAIGSIGSIVVSRASRTPPAGIGALDLGGRDAAAGGCAGPPALTEHLAGSRSDVRRWGSALRLDDRLEFFGRDSEAHARKPDQTEDR